MTDQMGDEQLDREIRAFLAGEAEDVAGAPTAMEMAVRIGSQAGSRTIAFRQAPQLAWMLIAGLLIAALVAVAGIGALSRRADDLPLQTSYEAVFLRREQVADGSASVLVFGVDAQGRQREITRLPVDANGVRVPTMGAVSPSGLLVVPRVGGAAMLHYEIIDLHRPTAEPIVVAGIEQDSEQVQDTPYFDTGRRPGIFWGPEEQVAIPWYDRTDADIRWHVGFVDGRTGRGPSVDLPGDMGLLPHWASDGSGVMLSGPATDEPLSVLRPDGTLSAGATGIAPSTYSRHYGADGAQVPKHYFKRLGQSYALESTLVLDGMEIADMAWTASGDGTWRVVRSGTDGRVLQVERVVSTAEPETVARIPDVATDAAGSRPEGHFVGLAPDDSKLILSLHRVTGTPDNGSTDPVSAVKLVATGSGATYEIEGNFAGWMEVVR